MTPLTLTDLLDQLSLLDADAFLYFAADGQRIHGGYHVTEFQVASIRSMTCGGETDQWKEARVQIMDGHGLSNPMTVRHFLKIAASVTERFSEIAELQLSVEFAPDNQGLRIYRPDAPVVDGSMVTVGLRSDAAQCKAAAVTSCCGTGSQVCCSAA